MIMHLRGSTSFHQPKREREILELISNRFHSYYKLVGLDNMDVAECLLVKTKQVPTQDDTYRFKGMIDITFSKIKGKKNENKK